MKALMLIGMASERTRTLTDFRNQPHEWNIDFYTDIFRALDAAPIEDVIAYKETVRQQGGDNDFERFLAARCFQNASYFNELIGTKYMREEQFDKAIEYLSKVPAAYDTTLNVYPYFRRNPFNDNFHQMYTINARAPGYKRNFAKKMLSFQNEMNTAKSEEAKILATYQYALGLMHATSDCWALLHYQQGYIGNYYNLSERLPEMEAHCLALFAQVLETSNSNELKAKCLAAQVWMTVEKGLVQVKNTNGNWVINSDFKELYRQLTSPPFATTEISKQLVAECDVLQWYTRYF
jgi:tetratricopeptide (TPR) repeat protein